MSIEDKDLFLKTLPSPSRLFFVPSPSLTNGWQPGRQKNVSNLGKSNNKIQNQTFTDHETIINNQRELLKEKDEEIMKLTEIIKGFPKRNEPSANKRSPFIKNSQFSGLKSNNIYNENSKNETSPDFLNQLEETYKTLSLRCMKVDELIDLLEYDCKHQNLAIDVGKIKELLKELMAIFGKTSKFGKLNYKTRELEKRNLDYQILLSRFKKLNERCDNLQTELNGYKSIRTDLLNDNFKSQKLLLHEKKNNSEFQKKYDAVSKRIEFILESDLSSALNNQDKVRKSLTEMMKENSHLKKELQLKSKEMERLNEKLNKSNIKIERLTRKMNTLKKKEKNEGEESGSKNFTHDNVNRDTLNFLAENSIPGNIDYRINSLKPEYSNLLADIFEHGVEAFSQHILQTQNPNLKQEEISLVSSQFLSYKEFSEKLNILIREISKMYSVQSLEGLMIFLNSSFKKVFLSERINLWMADAMTGVLYTINSEKTKVECLMSHGLFGEIMKNGKPVNRREIKAKILYQTLTEKNGERVDSALLFPLKNDRKRVIGILEITNIFNDVFGFDEEYFGIVLNEFTNNFVNQILKREILKTEQKYSDMIYEAFAQMVEADNFFQLTKAIEEWTKKIFSIQQVKFYLVEQQGLNYYNSKNQEKQTNKLQGLAGCVAINQKSNLITDYKSSSTFDKNIDIESLLPLYAFPILEKEETQEENFNISNAKQVQTLAVIEIVLKQRIRVKDEKELMNLEFVELGMNENYQNIIETFSRFIRAALEFIQEKNIK